MKKRLLNFAFAAICFFGSAQITLTQSDMPAPNSFALTAADTLFNGGGGPSGASQFWNYFFLGNHAQGGTSFVSPTGQMGASDFPLANMCIASPQDSAWVYMQVSAGSYEILGFYGYEVFFGGWFALKFNPTYIFTTLPATYNTSFNNTAKASLKAAYPSPPADSVWLKQSIVQSSNMDGFGYLTTPVSVYNVLRQKVTEIKADSVFARISGVWTFIQATPDTEVIYRWWANSKLYPVFEMSYDGSGNKKKPASYLLSSNVGMQDQVVQDVSVIAFPSPAESSINFTFPENAKGASFVIYDAAGREVSSMIIQNTQINMSTSSYEAGPYFFRYLNNADGSVMNGKFIVAK